MPANAAGAAPGIHDFLSTFYRSTMIGPPECHREEAREGGPTKQSRNELNPRN
jgi:hypothetical protein